MNIRHLKIFLAVVETNSMNQAAKKLSIAQPTVSQAIKELESYYGIVLFERLNQKLYITDQGKKLLPLAKHVVESFNTLDIIMRNTSTYPTLKVGGSVSVGTAMLPELIMRFENEMKNVQTEVVVNNTTVIENMLLNSELDVAIVEGIIKSDDLISIPIHSDELMVVVGKHHPFYHAHNITLNELQNQPAIMREDGSDQLNQYEQLLKDNYIELDKKWYSINTEAIKQAVIKSDKLSIMSTMIIQDELRRGELRALNVKDVRVKQEINLVVHREKYISEYLERFMEISRNYFKR